MANESVEVTTKEGDVLNGILMPSNDNKILNLKLNSGYNINIDKKKISKIKKIENKIKNTEIKHNKLNKNPNLKNIMILHSGGTIASKVNYESGAVSPKFEPEELISLFPELKEIANIESKLVGNIFSEDARFSHYNLIAKEIEKSIENVDGIIVTHGTDNLALAACALSFILENLNKPVILVGAQRSSDRPSTDSAFNLISAVQFITNSNFNEVGICMHGKSSDDYCCILPSCKTRKLHTSRRDAFKPVNSNIIAKVDKNGKVEFLHKYIEKKHKDKLKLRLFNEKLKIGILKAHPNMFAFEVKNCSKFDGLVLESTGIGCFPINSIDKFTKEHKLIYNELRKLSKKIPVVISSQCIFGRINLNVYDTGRKLKEIGIIGNFSDMVAETAFIKLSWLLSNYKKNEVSELFMENFRGELNLREEYAEEFV